MYRMFRVSMRACALTRSDVG